MRCLWRGRRQRRSGRGSAAVATAGRKLHGSVFFTEDRFEDSDHSDRPHLHVEAYASLGNFVKSNTLPITFSNAEGPLAPSGELVQDQAYSAAPVP